MNVSVVYILPHTCVLKRERSLLFWSNLMCCAISCTHVHAKAQLDNLHAALKWGHLPARLVSQRGPPTEINTAHPTPSIFNHIPFFTTAAADRHLNTDSGWAYPSLSGWCIVGCLRNYHSPVRVTAVTGRRCLASGVSCFFLELSD